MNDYSLLKRLINKNFDKKILKRNEYALDDNGNLKLTSKMVQEAIYELISTSLDKKIEEYEAEKEKEEAKKSKATQ